jgi:GMP synthase PP-ATPase subunit
LHDEADIGGAALLAVIEAIAELLGEQRPIRELPDAVGVHTATLAAASKTVLGDNLLRVFVDEGESSALGREFEF